MVDFGTCVVPVFEYACFYPSVVGLSVLGLQASSEAGAVRVAASDPRQSWPARNWTAPSGSGQSQEETATALSDRTLLGSNNPNARPTNTRPTSCQR